MNKTQRKKLISMRFSLDILKEIDAITENAGFNSRTEFVETACCLFAAYMYEVLENGVINE